MTAVRLFAANRLSRCCFRQKMGPNLNGDPLWNGFSLGLEVPEGPERTGSVREPGWVLARVREDELEQEEDFKYPENGIIRSAVIAIATNLWF